MFISKFHLRQISCILLTLVLSSTSSNAQWWKKFGLRLEEAYDSNVYLQDVTDLAYQQSWISIAQPSIELGWKSVPFSFDFGYAPRIAVYHDEPSESNQAHNLTLNFRGAEGNVSWELLNAFCAVNGVDTSPLYTGVGGNTAIGGFEVRDRRDSFWVKQNGKVTWTQGKFFTRAVYTGYLHDFRVQERTTPGYCNYADRKNINGGLDFGYQALPATWLVAGYRYGAQEQDDYTFNPVHYSNRYQRVLFGAEGQPAKWIKFNLLAGPTFHRFSLDVPDEFGRNHTRLYVDGALSLTPTPRDSFQFSLSRFEQMTSGGCSAYQDIVYRAAYSRVLTDDLEVKATLRIYRGEFETTAVRDDTIYTPGIQLNWKMGGGVLCTLAYAYEWSESDLPEMPAREYTRHQASISFSRSF